MNGSLVLQGHHAQCTSFQFLDLTAQNVIAGSMPAQGFLRGYEKRHTSGMALDPSEEHNTASQGFCCGILFPQPY